MYEFLYRIISTPFGYVMRFIYEGVGNYALSLFLFALLVKVLMIPMTIKQKRSMLEQQRIRPMIEKIQKTYARDQRRMQEEMQNLYDREGVSPMAGCGTMLLTFPILIGLYGVIIQPLTYFMQIGGDQIAEIARILNFDTAAAGYHYQIELATLIYENFDKVSHVSENLMQVNFALGPISMAAKPVAAAHRFGRHLLSDDLAAAEAESHAEQRSGGEHQQVHDADDAPDVHLVRLYAAGGPELLLDLQQRAGAGSGSSDELLDQKAAGPDERGRGHSRGRSESPKEKEGGVIIHEIS